MNFLKSAKSLKAIRLPGFTRRFILEGYNLERFIIIMGKNGVPLLYLRRKGLKKLICVCYQADMPAVEALAAEKGWKITDPKPLGLAAVLAFLGRRWGIPVGFALMIALSIIMYQFIWRVEIQGAEQYHGDISAYLSAEGFTPGTLKTRIDARTLTQNLNRRYPEVAWFNVYVHDMTLVVDCTLGVPPPDLESGEPGDLVALRDGMITEVIVYAGTPAVKAGDIVRKGQVLIRGLERSPFEWPVDVEARGVVKARCWRSKTVNMPLREILSDATGRVTEHQQIETPWFSLPADIETPSYLAYDTEITLIPFVGSYVPLWIRKTVFHEVSLEFAQRNAEMVKEEAGKAAMQRLQDSLWGNEIVDKWVDYCMIENNLMSATATAEWIMDIGSPRLP